MDDSMERWGNVIGGGLKREVPGGLDPDLAARVESRLARSDSAETGPLARAGVSLALFGTWLVLAASLVFLHLRAAPAAHESLWAAVGTAVDGARLDLIAASVAAFLLVEATARLRN